MTAGMVVIVQVLCCLGLGAVALRACALLDRLARLECLTWSFAVGFGVLGWLMFFLGCAGWLSTPQLWALEVAGVVGLWTLLPRLRGIRWRLGPEAAWLGLALMIVLLLDLIEGVSPPADADSLAYHFAGPKRFLAIGALDFVPRAVDGAAPFLVQMTYLPALGLGGERALTLWTMVSGWAAAALVFTSACRFVDKPWAAAVALLFLTTPAVIFGGGTGQVEVRAALFVIVAALAVADIRNAPSSRYALLAGLMVGFYVGTKYLGLLFALASGIGLLAVSRTPARAVRLIAIFSSAALLAGFQWYFWNWLHSGDPIFPFLIGRFGIGDVSLWPADYHKWFESGFFDVERGVPNSIVWLFLYPIKATFAGAPEFESARTGLGPFLPLIVPLALLGGYQARQRLASSPLTIMAGIGILFYALWFLTGSSQRVRHLVPVYPLILIPAAVAAERYSRQYGFDILLRATAVTTLLLQMPAHAVYSTNYARYALGFESRQEFLRRNITAFDLVDWINRNLGLHDRILTTQRQLVYFLNVPVLYGHQYLDARVDLRADTLPDRLVAQLRGQGVTYVLLAQGIGADGEKRWGPVDLIWEPLKSAGCMTLLYSGEFTNITSRTLAIREGRFVAEIYALERSCRL
jgi:hypothetical protein